MTIVIHLGSIVYWLVIIAVVCLAIFLFFAFIGYVGGRIDDAKADWREKRGLSRYKDPRLAEICEQAGMHEHAKRFR